MTRATRSVRLNREMREGTLPTTLIAKTYHPGNVTDVSRPLIGSLSDEFQCHQRKTNTSFEANQSALFACSIRYILCGTGPLPVCVCIPIQRYGTIAAHIPAPCVRPRRVCSVLRARVQFCRFVKANATADVQ